MVQQSNKAESPAASEDAASELPSVPAGPSLLKLGAVAAQYLILSLLILVLRIEGSSFVRITAIAGIGFVFHHFLPMRWRLPFFSLLSLVGIGVGFGVPFGQANAAALVGIGLVLIGLAHLPVAFSLRLTLLAVVGIVLIAIRATWVTLPLAPAVWPILGAMFMFRLPVYVYDLKTRSAPFSFWQATAYFFMLPNVCFPLYPIVDYKAFTKTYYNDDPIAIYQKGVQWIFRGVVHLLLYRFVYQNLLIDPGEVTDDAGVLQYVLATFLLYLNVSGTFHVIVGMLHLFGFNLSETHHLYMLSASFTDFWRRINVYWKDFIQKLFFYPVYFRSRRWGDTAAMVVATIAAFAATWFLHSYQTFWIVGRFPLVGQDIVFWGGLGCLVLANVLYESKAKRRRRLKGDVRSWKSELGRALRTVGTFVAIVFLWSVWTSASFSEWGTLMSKLANVTPRGVAMMAGIVVVIGAGAVLLGHSSTERTEGASRSRPSSATVPFWRTAATTALASTLLLALALRPNLLSFDRDLVAGARRLRSAQLSARDARLLERGYYEDLTHGIRFSPELRDMYMVKPPDWVDLPYSDVIRNTEDFFLWELIPSEKHTFKRATLTTNRWGMRDRDYAKAKPPGCYRVVLLGASIVMGSGVEDDETFEAVLEKRLNHDQVGGPGKKFEILNLAVGGYGTLRKLHTLRTKGLDFDPDAVLYMAHSRESWRAGQDMLRARQRGVEIPYEDLLEHAQESARAEGNAANILDREILRAGLTRLSKVCKERGIRTYFALLETVDGRRSGQDANRVVQIARGVGFTVLDLSDFYANLPDRKSLQIAPWDTHPNAKAHRMIADALYQRLRPHLEREILGQDPS